MNLFSSWICNNSTKNLFVKVVHPGGLIELYDRPVVAAELLQRHPKCCVAYPTVFQQPYDVVSPTTTLVFGQKYYVVPIDTIRKLQLKLKLKLKISPLKNQLRVDVQLSNDHRREGKSRKKIKGGDDCKKLVESMYCCSLKRNSDDNKNGKKAEVSVAALDHWQPGLESIREE